MERIKEVKASLSVQAEKGYDPDDPNADETGHVWVISISLCKSADAMYLCTDGLIR
jgi:flagellar basal body rod protein FlgC